MVSDLKLLIDISCESIKGQVHFTEFHTMLIRMANKATDVNIDYTLKRISMNVLSEDESFDLVAIDQFAGSITVKLSYDNLNEFLKSCILESIEVLKHYYPFLVSSFNKRKTSLLLLESA
jgi:hypothetical protein